MLIRLEGGPHHGVDEDIDPDIETQVFVGATGRSVYRNTGRFNARNELIFAFDHMAEVTSRPTTIDLSPPEPPATCRCCGKPAASRVLSVTMDSPREEAGREILRERPLPLCQACYPNKVWVYCDPIHRKYDYSTQTVTSVAEALVTKALLAEWA